MKDALGHGSDSGGAGFGNRNNPSFIKGAVNKMKTNGVGIAAGAQFKASTRPLAQVDHVAELRARLNNPTGQGLGHAFVSAIAGLFRK